MCEALPRMLSFIINKWNIIQLLTYVEVDINCY